jgi:hypothetical protein
VRKRLEVKEFLNTPGVQKGQKSKEERGRGIGGGCGNGSYSNVVLSEHGEE